MLDFKITQFRFGGNPAAYSRLSGKFAVAGRPFYFFGAVQPIENQRNVPQLETPLHEC